MKTEAELPVLAPTPRVMEMGTGTVPLAGPLQLAAAESMMPVLPEILARAGNQLSRVTRS